jgi:hypothetical protein
LKNAIDLREKLLAASDEQALESVVNASFTGSESHPLFCPGLAALNSSHRHEPARLHVERLKAQFEAELPDMKARFAKADAEREQAVTASQSPLDYYLLNGKATP